ncbi:probable membrane-associated kinase regulator 2 [Macadamia integrifolia]|uniref:probable membrane-associated kinase regulator 2 n=1 Tax=Macadamia integrifolia TaxID=60698 RepID=UPI001C4E9152|nr:probable membrane-associated kinase regulator 2 [Macadamia integrifolia]
MEVFSLLKYWKGGGVTENNERTIPGTTTISTTLQPQPAVETEEDGDDGSFFDMEFTVPEDDDGEGGDEHDNSSGVDEEDDSASLESAGIDGEEFNFRVSSGSSDRRTDLDVDPSLSPSDDLFFKGRLVPLEPSSLEFNHSETNLKPQFPVSLLKSATKIRVLMLGFKKPKSTMADKMERNSVDGASRRRW